MDTPAPIQRGDSGLAAPVLGGGLLTGALALLAVWALNHWAPDVNVMGWYANYVIPVGAILVGIAAGSGYGLAAWWLDRRVSNVLLGVIVVLQLAAYGGAQYFEFRDLQSKNPELAGVTFIHWFDFATRNFAWVGRDGQPGEPFGAWGYAIRALEMAGFAFGGLVAPLILRTKPYCANCGVYMSSRQLATLPGSRPPQKFKKHETVEREEFERTSAEVLDQAMKLIEQLAAHAARGELAEIQAALAPYQGAASKEHNKLPRRLMVSINECRMCTNGTLNVVAHEGFGNQIKTQDVLNTPLVMNPPHDDAAPAA